MCIMEFVKIFKDFLKKEIIPHFFFGSHVNLLFPDLHDEYSLKIKEFKIIRYQKVLSYMGPTNICNILKDAISNNQLDYFWNKSGLENDDSEQKLLKQLLAEGAVEIGNTTSTKEILKNPLSKENTSRLGDHKLLKLYSQLLDLGLTKIFNGNEELIPKIDENRDEFFDPEYETEFINFLLHFE